MKFIMGRKTVNKKYYVYMLSCSDDSLYTGYTTDLKKRMVKHNEGKGAKYTRGRTPVRLAYFEEGEDLSWALRRENELKSLAREQKLKLLEEGTEL
jgi:putative endonuclease